MNKTTLSRMKKEELLELCKKNKIKVEKSATKDMIINLLINTKEEATKETKKEPTKKKTTVAKRQRVEKTEIDSKVAKTKYEVVKDNIDEKKESYVLPTSYNEDRIVVLVRDPYLVYAYWDFSIAKIKEYGLNQDSKIILRTYDVDRGTFFDVELPSQMRNCYFQVPSSGRKYFTEVGFLKSGKFITIAKSNDFFVPPDKVEYDFSKLEPSEYRKAEEIYRQSGGYVIKKIVGSDVVFEWRGISPGEWSGVSSGGSGGFSFEKPGVVAKNFWLELNTELVIYGSTSPDARLTIGGVPVELSHDGKFSMRFHFKDGEYKIPVVSISSDGEKKIEITPVMLKSTKRKEY
ncbi:MAG: DUF4912 domain-containing protein [Brevinematales bacterium]|nr:DUF4912 domain-containing protein [Brevinematales bacterium]